MKDKKYYIDPSTKIKSLIVKNNIRLFDGFPVFTLLEFNIFGACNRKCDFCPVSDPKFFKNKYEGITLELYTKILHDLKEIGYNGEILYSAFSEPLLHKQIYELLSATKEVLPDCRIDIVSNGDVIKSSPEKILKLFDSGLDSISISIYDGPQQMEHFKNMTNELNMPDKKVNLRRRYLEDKNFGMTISNRAGVIDSNKYRDIAEKKITKLPLPRNCYYPFYQMVIDYNGDIIICPHDWKKESLVGNASRENIFEVWRNNKFERFRSILSNNNREFLPCMNCDVRGDVMGEENFKTWQEAHK